MAVHDNAPLFPTSISDNLHVLIPKRTVITDEYDVKKNVLGVGINGKVYECIQKRTKIKCALKIIKDSQKARREVEIHNRVCEQPNIVKIFDVFENNFNGVRSLVVVMENMQGGELFERIQQKQHFNEREASAMVRQICLAVAYIHRHDIAHRDLKPENLLFASRDDESLLKLTDFGFAKICKGLSLQTPCYTPYYVAPEVLGPDKYDKSCDIWSIGVIMYILLCGYPPFYSNTSEPFSQGMKKRIKLGQYSFPENEWEMISCDAKDLVTKLLKVDVKERYTIEQVVAHPWIRKFNEVPQTPLATNKILKEEKQTWEMVQDTMEISLADMRIKEEEEGPLKPPEQLNPMLLRRQKKASSLVKSNS
eukprot:TRINITY_DN2780_c0_g1_i1.p1 TRINITY_DN2780_c0_g1~~TRINITY_DN2780_c0_g1_i1.p1  ORF type:complete len:365 (-),score=13.98 TRINITY_DN2780_c0_g1_i1:218-1312(-)